MHAKPRIQFLFAAVLGLVVWGGFAAHAEAASFSFRTSSAVVHQMQELAVDVIVDPEGENLNTISAAINIPNNLSFVDSDDSASFVGFWVDQPKYLPETNTFFLSGIVPGGFSGQIDPFSTSGDASGGVVIRLVFRGKVEGSGKLSFGSASAYLSDTLGAEARISTRSLGIIVDKLIGGAPLLNAEDTEEPLPFTPVLERDLLLYGGQYVVIFNTKDKGSGIDHYEVKEGNGDFVEAESPYLLLDQKVSGDIVVKAVDRAGNAQYGTIRALNHFPWWQVLSGGALLLIIFIWLVLKKRKEEVVYS
jgi:hypothetical protein